MRNRCGINHGCCEFDTATVAAVHGLDGWVGSMDGDFADEQIRVAEMLIQQLRAAGANPLPLYRAALQNQ